MDIEEVIEALMAIRPKFTIFMHIKDADPERFKKIVEEKLDIKVILL